MFLVSMADIIGSYDAVRAVAVAKRREYYYCYYYWYIVVYGIRSEGLCKEF